MMFKRLVRIDAPAERELHREYHASERSTYERGGVLCGQGDGKKGYRIESIAPYEQTLPSQRQFSIPALSAAPCHWGSPLGVYHTHPKEIAYPSAQDRRDPALGCVLGMDGMFCHRGDQNVGLFRWKGR